jgi:SpoVK/Ycf46/Vps4 family AAA+-type ATPase
LKNLCVTAALAAVREQIAGEHANENDILDLDAIRERALAQHQVPGGLTGERVLSRRHFELALKEIAPSCSDEMQTLAELRRWDRLYGDRGGRSGAFRRKAMGFGTEQHAVS